MGPRNHVLSGGPDPPETATFGDILGHTQTCRSSRHTQRHSQKRSSDAASGYQSTVATCFIGNESVPGLAISNAKILIY